MKLLDVTLTTDTKGVIQLVPFGCLHRDDPGFREHLWQDLVDFVLNTPGAYCIGLGDYNNFLRSTARRHLKSYTKDENSFLELDAYVRTDARAFYAKYLKKLADKRKLIGLLEGNHYHQFQNNTTDTQFLCELAGVPYLTELAMLRLHCINTRTGSGVARVLTALVHHGDWSPGAATHGSDLAAAERKLYQFGDFDILLVSHTHRKYASLIPSLRLMRTGEIKVWERPRVIIRSGAFVAAYDQCTPSHYAHKKLLPPTELGYVTLRIEFYRKYDKARRERQAKRTGVKNRGAVTNWLYRFVVSY